MELITLEKNVLLKQFGRACKSGIMSSEAMVVVVIFLLSKSYNSSSFLAFFKLMLLIHTATTQKRLFLRKQTKNHSVTFLCVICELTHLITDKQEIMSNTFKKIYNHYF